MRLVITSACARCQRRRRHWSLLVFRRAADGAAGKFEHYDSCKGGNAVHARAVARCLVTNCCSREWAGRLCSWWRCRRHSRCRRPERLPRACHGSSPRLSAPRRVATRLRCAGAAHAVPRRSTSCVTGCGQRHRQLRHSMAQLSHWAHRNTAAGTGALVSLNTTQSLTAPSRRLVEHPLLRLLFCHRRHRHRACSAVFLLRASGHRPCRALRAP